jgi:hypothetical protein
MGRADTGVAGGVRPPSGIGWVARLLVAGLVASSFFVGCGEAQETATPLHVTLAPEGADTRVTLHAAPAFRINAHIAPALELRNGTVVRFAGDRLTADSAYYAEPPSARLTGRHDQLHGILRASVCAEKERVCRSVVLAL